MTPLIYIGIRLYTEYNHSKVSKALRSFCFHLQNFSSSVPEKDIGDLAGWIDLNVEGVTSGTGVSGGGHHAAASQQAGEEAERADGDDGVVARRQQSHVVNLVQTVCGINGEFRMECGMLGERRM